MSWQTGEAVAIAAYGNTAREQMEHSAAARVLDPITQFQLYEDYLDSKVTPMDLFYSKVSPSRIFDLSSPCRGSVPFGAPRRSEPLLPNCYFNVISAYLRQCK